MLSQCRCGLWLSVIALSFLWTVRGTFAQTASVREGQETFRTYPFSDPDPVPRMSNIYPYFRFDGYSLTASDRRWKIVTMENPYLKLVVAPEMGGKVLGAFERSGGKPFIYFNKVIKFREISMRGPWTSGGLEFNFGDIGHTPTTATPLDYLTRKNDDGSVSCIIGALDLASRTEWTVEIRLPKDKAYFETRSSWYNPTDLNTSMYHWQCTAIDGAADLHLMFPGTHYIGHGGELQPWPLDTAGRDVSLYAVNNFGSYKSYHVLGAYTDYFAARFADEDFGVVHWADYGEKPGRKIWIWGLSRQGEIWKGILTDPDLGNKQYVEIQSGLLFNQAASSSSRTPFKHEFFPPLSGEHFTEAWFPFMKIGGIVQADTLGALNVQEEGGTVTVGFCPLRKIAGDLIATIGGTETYRRALRLKPLEVFTGSFKRTAPGALAISVGDRLFYSSSDEEDRKLRRPLAAHDDFDWNSLYGLYTDGVEQARQRNPAGALEKFTACLKKDPLFTPALVGIAEVYYKRMDYEKALEQALRALANDTYDPDANFIYGVINKKLGRLYDAKDGFAIASRSMKYRSAASAELATISFLQNRLAEASGFLQRAVDYDRFNAAAYRLMAVIARKVGNLPEARKIQRVILSMNPLDHFAEFEGRLIDRQHTKATGLGGFLSTIRNEFPHETCLELSAYYMGLGLKEEASKVLEAAPSHPMVNLWLACILDKLNRQEESTKRLALALAGSPRLVFPFRGEDADVLDWALGKSRDWKLTYYRALLDWSRDRRELAMRGFDACGDQPDYAPFYIARGNFLRVERPDQVLREYLRALEVGPDEWRAYQVVADHYNDLGRHKEALDIFMKASGRFPGHYTLSFNIARTLLYNGRLREAAAILDTITILATEGARFGRDVHRQAFMLLAADTMTTGHFKEAIGLLSKARLWPERLGVGRPYDVDDRVEDYLEAAAHRELNDTATAAQLYRKVIDYTEAHPLDWGPNTVVAVMALKNLAFDERAAQLLKKWRDRKPDDIIQRWGASVYNLATGDADKIRSDLMGTPGASLLSRSQIDPNFALNMELAGILERTLRQR